MMKLKDLKGSYKCVRIFEPSPQSAYNGIPYIAENAEKIVEALRKHLETQGCKDFKVEYGNNGKPLLCYFGNQFYYLPQTPKEAQGRIEIETTQYYFIYTDHEGVEKMSHGPRIKKAMLTDYGFILVIPNGVLHYHLGEKLS